MEEQEILHHRLSGISVVTTQGREVGRFREVRDLKSATPLRGHGEDGEHLIPFTQELLVGLSPEEAALVIDFFSLEAPLLQRRRLVRNWKVAPYSTNSVVLATSGGPADR